MNGLQTDATKPKSFTTTTVISKRLEYVKLHQAVNGFYLDTRLSLYTSQTVRVSYNLGDFQVDPISVIVSKAIISGHIILHKNEG